MRRGWRRLHSSIGANFAVPPRAVWKGSSIDLIRRLPIVGVLAGVVLLLLAAARYPGDADLARVTASALCAWTLPDNAPNPVHWLAAGGLLLLCAGVALLFQLIAWQADSRLQEKTIQIAGIGSMVYAALTATPMHNLLLNISLAFYLVALLAILQLLYGRRRFALFAAGLGCISVLLAVAAFYYAGALTAYLGVFQKLSFALSTAWLLTVCSAVAGSGNRKVLEPTNIGSTRGGRAP